MQLRNEFEPIREWAKERGIYEKGTVRRQFEKLLEEVDELNQAILENMWFNRKEDFDFEKILYKVFDEATVEWINDYFYTNEKLLDKKSTKITELFEEYTAKTWLIKIDYVNLYFTDLFLNTRNLWQFFLEAKKTFEKTFWWNTLLTIALISEFLRFNRDYSEHYELSKEKEFEFLSWKWLEENFKSLSRQQLLDKFFFEN